jgi:hypothetical protein
VGHDDGLTLIVGGETLINAPGASSFVVTPSAAYSGSASPTNVSFELVYGECCGAPAILSATLPLATPTTIPEPSSVALFGIGLLAMGVGLKRKRA